MNKLVGEPDGATPLEPEEMEGLLHKHVTTRGQLDELEPVSYTHLTLPTIYSV